MAATGASVVLCRIAGIHASHHKKRSKPGSTALAPHEDLLAVVDEHRVVRREFVADGPNKVWLTDITEHKTGEGKLYLCAIKDVFSNKIVGYSIDSRMKSSLAVRALSNAVALRGNVAGCVIHSDRGSQGGLKWSSQHLDREVERWGHRTGRRVCGRIGARSPRPVGRRSRGAKTESGSGWQS